MSVAVEVCPSCQQTFVPVRVHVPQPSSRLAAPSIPESASHGGRDEFDDIADGR
jgi:hypothetical protein